MSTAERLRPRRGAAWWVGLTVVVFGAMIAWALRFTFGYLLTPLTCELGVWVQALISAIFILAGLAALAIDLVLLRRELDLAARFLLFVGVALNAFFVGVMLLETTAIAVVDACAKGAIP